MVLLIFNCFGLLALRITRNGRRVPLESDPPEALPVVPDESYRVEAPRVKGMRSGADQDGTLGYMQGPGTLNQRVHPSCSPQLN